MNVLINQMSIIIPNMDRAMGKPVESSFVKLLVWLVSKTLGACAISTVVISGFPGSKNLLFMRSISSLLKCEIIKIFLA